MNEPGENVARRLGAMITLLSAALALGCAGLIAAPVCVLTMALILAVSLVVPYWLPALLNDSPQRTTLALVAVGLLTAATAGSGPKALFSGEISGRLDTAVAELALPEGVPIGLLAALAAGALVAVSLELADRRGVQSALVLGIAVLGLASVAAPGTRLLPALIPGWPAAMFVLARLAASVDTAPGLRSQPAQSGRFAARTAARLPMMRRTTMAGAASTRALVRWQVVPVLAVITVALVLLTLAVLSGVSTIGEKAASNRSTGGATATTGGRLVSDYLGSDMDLNARGTLPADPLLEVPVGSPIRWRAGTLDQYDGRRWLATDSPDGLPRFVVGSDGSAEEVDPPQPILPTGYRVDQARMLRAGMSQVLAPGRILSISSTSLSAGGKVFVTPGDRMMMSVDAGYSRYQVRSQVLPGVDNPDAATTLGSSPEGGSVLGESTGTIGRPATDEALDPRWTTLPPTVPDRVRLLGRNLVTGAPSRLVAVRAIEAELARRMTYVLDSPVPPPGADAVDDVLFVSHSGFCEQFATAEVVLLRSAGVPARMAVGFSGGEPGPAGYRTVRRSDAHAWVEVWFPGIGWVTSDPTPAAAETRSWWDHMVDVVRSLLDEPAVWVATVVVVLGLASGLVLFRRRSRRAVVDDHPTRAVDPDLAAAFSRLEAALLAEGRPRAPNETVASLAGRLAWQQRQNQPFRPPDPALTRALLVLERALYASQPPSRQECQTAATDIDQRDHVTVE